MVQGSIKGCKGPADPLDRPLHTGLVDRHTHPRHTTPITPTTYDSQLTANLRAAPAPDRAGVRLSSRQPRTPH
jgi:hypothetical protein